MITINLSRMHNMRPAVQFCLSPLFEAASSLRTLTQPSPAIRHRAWVQQTVDTLKREGIYAEWEYFSPLFSHALPEQFRPNLTSQIANLEQLYDYLVDLPLSDFIRYSMNALPPSSPGTKSMLLRRDMEFEPEVVKGRFDLFFSTYLHLVFAAAWTETAQALVSEQKRMSAKLQTIANIGQFMEELSPYIRFDSEAKSLSIASDERQHLCRQAESVVICPSWFVADSPQYFFDDKRVYVIYRIPARSMEANK